MPDHMADHATTARVSTSLAETKPVAQAAPSSLPEDLAGWFERFDTIYRDADGDVTRIPWAHARACPWALDWLNRRGREFVRAGARIAVAGCGLGNDVGALIDRGYEAIGLDVCPSAIAAARRRFLRCAEAFEVADLFDLPSRLRHRFDLVLEVHTLQSLPPEHRGELAAGIASLLKPRGHVLAIARGRARDLPLASVEGPPFAFTREELAEAFAGCGLVPTEPIEVFTDQNAPPVQRLRGLFGRPRR